MLYSSSLFNLSVRIVDGVVDEWEGRVEVYSDGAWGTICDDNWSLEDADVVCRSLGNGGGAEAVYSGAYFGQGTGDILLDDLLCSGQESNIFDCVHSGVGVHDCTHAQDAGLRCAPISKLLLNLSLQYHYTL